MTEQEVSEQNRVTVLPLTISTQHLYFPHSLTHLPRMEVERIDLVCVLSILSTPALVTTALNEYIPTVENMIVFCNKHLLKNVSMKNF